MARITVKKSDRSIRIGIAGDAAMHHCAKAAEFLSSVACADWQDCVIDLSGVTEIDLPYLQMLVSFVRTAESKDMKTAFIPLEENHPVLVLAAKLGLPGDFLPSARRGHGI